MISVISYNIAGIYSALPYILLLWVWQKPVFWGLATSWDFSIIVRWLSNEARPYPLVKMAWTNTNLYGWQGLSPPRTSAPGLGTIKDSCNLQGEREDLEHHAVQKSRGLTKTVHLAKSWERESVHKSQHTFSAFLAIYSIIFIIIYIDDCNVPYCNNRLRVCWLDLSLFDTHTG